MANKPLDMLQIRRCLVLLQEARSVRQIHRLTGIHRNTVKSYVERFKHSGKTYAELLALPDHDLAELIYPPRHNHQADDRYLYLSGRLQHYADELKRPHVTRQRLWEEYLEQQPHGYRYAQFCLHLDRYIQQHEPTMPQVHHPGDKLQIDFAGDPLRYYDPVAHEWINCPVLVCSLPCSAMFYAEPLTSSRQEHLIPALNSALAYFGGVPRNILSDNMAQVVTKPSRYEPVFTELVEQWALHYRTNMQATRVAKPKDKASVENSVHIAYQQIYAAMRNECHHSLKALKHRVRELLEKANERTMTAYGKSRKERFLELEKEHLAPLPPKHFVYKHQAKAKVKKNYHVILGEDWHQYSVPHAYIGQRVKLIYDDDVVEIFCEYKRIAVHQRAFVRNGYSTIKEHMPESHRNYLLQKGWTPDDFLEKAHEIGPGTEEVVTRFLAAKAFPEQSYDACIGLLRLAKGFGRKRLENACSLALQGSRVTYRIVKTILENNRDKLVLPTEEQAPMLPFHENIRGKHFYN
uniref:Integrase catalytic region n=1 Tax=Chlorobium phaeobacteroides (strain BS1) TaxID=331678 RepID=B3EKE6_CHLPB